MIVNGYTTREELSSYKDIKSLDPADDAVIDTLITAASRYIDGYTGRRFYTTSADETRTFTAAFGDLMLVGDLLSVTTFKTDDGSRTYATTWATTDYDLLPENAALEGRPYTCAATSPNGAYAFPTLTKGVQIVGKFGYSTTAPADIKLACQMIVVNVYSNRFGQSNSGAATITGAGVVITPADIPASALAIMRGYGVLY